MNDNLKLNHLSQSPYYSFTHILIYSITNYGNNKTI